MTGWYNQIDTAICTVIMSLSAVQIYASQHRMAELVSKQQIMSMMIYLPVLLIP